MDVNLRTVIIGAGSRAKVATEILELQKYNIVGYASSEPRGTIINGYPILCSIEQLIKENSTIGAQAVFVAIGDNYYRKKIIREIEKLNLRFINCIHPSARVSEKAILGQGLYIDAGSTIHPGVVIGDFVSIGVNSSISHDSIIKSHVNIAPGATLCGGVTVNKLSVVGPGAVIIEKIRIGENSIIGAGAVATKDVEADSVMMGVPAKFVKTREKGKVYLK